MLQVRRLLDEGRVSVHDTTEEGEPLLSLACSAGYYELAQVVTEHADFVIDSDSSVSVPRLPRQMSCC